MSVKYDDAGIRLQAHKVASKAYHKELVHSLAPTIAVHTIHNDVGSALTRFNTSNGIDEGSQGYDETATSGRIRGNSISQQRQLSPARNVRFDFDSKSNDSPAASPATHRIQSPTSDVPFSDGIVYRGSVSRQRLALDAASSVALKLDWPLDMSGYNETREGSSASSSSSSLPCAAGPTLVYYRTYLELRQKDTQNVGTVHLQKTEGAQAGSVMFRATCEAPCWTTDSRRYEAPICVGLGRAGPVLWQAVPSTPKKKKAHQQPPRDSSWTLVHVASGYQTRVRDEDLEMVRYSAVDEAGNVFVALAHAQPKVHLLYNDDELEVAHLDRTDGFGALHMDSRPTGTACSQLKNDPIDFAFLVALNEVINAIRDEIAGRGKGRRDNYGRLLPPKQNGLAKVLSRYVRVMVLKKGQG